MAENKRQHFVPQLYLRNFSKDSKTLAVFSIKENKIVTRNGPIDRQCYENYLYGQDLKFEKSLSELEGITQPIFREILRNKPPKRKTENYFTLLVYILYQSARTIVAGDQLNEMVDQLMKNIIKDDLEFTKNTDITAKDVEEAKIFFKQPYNFNLGIISEMIPLTLDLDYRLLINKTKTEFIATDNPVLLYNKYYFKELRSYIGLACKGLIIGIAISPTHYLMLFDSNLYKIKRNFLRNYCCISSESDVLELNKLHAANANKTLYTLNMDEKYLQYVSEESSKLKPLEKNTLRETGYKESSDGKLSKIVMTSKNSIKYNANFSFLKIKKFLSKSYLEQNLVRDPFLVKLHKEFSEKVQEKIYKPSEWGKFLKDKQK